jgi:hypothetical protein
MQATGRILANPNPIVLNEMGATLCGTPTGTASISWSAQGAREVEVRVGSPSGPLFARTGPEGGAKAASWIVNGTVFCLQDVTRGGPLSPDQTLATVRISLTFAPELLERHRAVLEQNLRLLHDILRDSPLANRYWVVGGLLLGWAREGRVLRHEPQDGDFGYFREDRERLLASIPRLIEAGFKPDRRLTSNDGSPVGYILEKDLATFEFSENQRLKGVIRSWNFGTHLRGNETVPIEIVCQVPTFDLAPMEFLGRTWLKPDDHDVYLRAVYGDWMTPNFGYSYVKDDPSIVEVHPWTGSSEWPAEELPWLQRRED